MSSFSSCTFFASSHFAHLSSHVSTSRSCTDAVCCMIFVIVILGYIALGTVGESDTLPTPGLVVTRAQTHERGHAQRSW